MMKYAPCFALIHYTFLRALYKSVSGINLSYCSHSSGGMFAFSPSLPRATPKQPRFLCTASKTLTRRAVFPIFSIPLTLFTAPVQTCGDVATETPYDLYAPSYDTLDGSNAITRFLGFDSLREALLSHAYGDVVELGIGTGQNLTRYSSSVTSLTGIDSSFSMLRIAQDRKRMVDFPVSLIRASADSTKLKNESFDTVVDTFSLCVYEKPLDALREMRRLVKPGGTVLLLEHSAGEGLVRAYQDFTAEAVKKMSKGCLPNQRVRDMVIEVGFRIVEETRIMGGSVVALRLV